MFVAGVVYTPSQYVILALSPTPEEALAQANLRLARAGVELPITMTLLEEALRAVPPWGSSLGATT